MELLSEPNTALDLYGRATLIRDWFAVNGERLKGFVRMEPAPAQEPRVTTDGDPTLEPGPMIDQKHQFATEAIRLAVIRDGVAEEHDIIQRELSEERVTAFTDQVRTAAQGSNPIEESFKRAGAFLLLAHDREELPEERGWNVLEPKAFLAEDSQTGHIYYTPLEGGRWGSDIAFDMTASFCREMDDSPKVVAALNTPENAVSAMDDAIAELGDPEELLLVWAGDWFDVEVNLNRVQPEGYQPQWQLQEPQMSWRIGRYRGHPIVRGPRHGERRLYAVDSRSWGILVRGQFEGDQDISVEISPVSQERAHELLEVNPEYFPDEPDLESKLLKLQASVQIRILIREEFRVRDRFRGRVIHALPELAIPNGAAKEEPE